MHTYYEFRVREKFAYLLPNPDDGELLSFGDIRKIILRDDDPRMADIERVTKKLKADGEFLFFGFDIRRKYSRSELDRAELFQLALSPFEPTGEECGTVYDESTACPICGGGRRQVSDLVLDLRKVPKSRDITMTIADEWIVSQRLAGLMFKAGLTGFSLRPVAHKARYRGDTIFFERLCTGRKALAMAESLGIKDGSWEWIVWINDPDQREMVEQIDREHAALGERQDRRRAKPLPLWYQLIVTGSVGVTVPPTTVGRNAFDIDETGRSRCPLGDTTGLGVVSEVSVARSAWDGTDLAVTENLFGCPRGDSLFGPAPLLLVSPRFWRLLQEHKMKAYRYDVAHLI